MATAGICAPNLTAAQALTPTAPRFCRHGVSTQVYRTRQAPKHVSRIIRAKSVPQPHETRALERNDIEAART
jgi:hypothetical protein